MVEHLYGVQLNEGGIPALVHDLLETHYGELFSKHRLLQEVRLRRPDASEQAIHRAIYRLVERGAVERVYVENMSKATSKETRFVITERAYWKEIAS